MSSSFSRLSARAARSRSQPLVLAAQRRVVDPEGVDLARSRSSHRDTSSRDVRDRALERPEGERQAALEPRGRRGSPRRPSGAGVIAIRIANVRPRRRVWRLARIDGHCGELRGDRAVSVAAGCRSRRRGRAPSTGSTAPGGRRRSRGRRTSAGRRRRGPASGSPRRCAGRGPASSAPPPASTMPWSMMSATSSGGVSSMVSLIVSTICGDRDLDRLADLVGADLDRARQAGEQVAAAERDPLRVPLARVGGRRSRS